jgi:hypothetical protein
MRVYCHPTTVLFDSRTLTELRKRAAKAMLISGERITPSGLARSLVEKCLFGEPRAESTGQQAQVGG